MGPLEEAVRRAIASVPALASEPDTAAVELAETYATAIDDGGNLEKLGPALLAALDSLRLTPRARGVRGGGADDGASDPLDELRARRAARIDNAEAVDAASS